MTWEELCEKANKMSLFIVPADSITPEHILVNDTLCFYKNGDIRLDDMDVEWRILIATDRTPSQMLAIMEALR